MRFIAMRFAAQTVLSGLGSLQFVIIPIASRFMLGIRASTSTVVGVTVVLLGNLLIILYGPAEVTFTLEQLRHQWSTPAMTTFLVVLGGLLCALQWLHWRISAAGGGMGGGQPPGLAASETSGKGSLGALSSSSGEEAGAVDRQHLLPAGSGKWVVGPPALGSLSSLGGLLGPRDQDAVLTFAGALLFSAVASFVGAWSVLFSKSLTYVVSYMPASLGDWYSWFILVAFLLTAAFWVRQSDRGLRYYPASLIMPLMQAFWMCMSVLEGGIYFDELIGLPSRHLALLMAGLVLALLGALLMGIAGFVAEKPEHVLLYAAADNELAAAEGGDGLTSPPPPRAVEVLVEKLHAATGRIDRLSSPVLRPTSAGAAATLRNGLTVHTGSGEGDKRRQWQGDGITQLHAVAGHPGGLAVELPPLGLGGGSPPGTSPRSLARMEAVRSPTQQLLSRENSGSQLDALGRTLHTAFDRALQQTSAAAAARGGGSSGPPQEVLLDSLSSPRAGVLQRR
ncbi:putative magnesium transporter NIPA8 [Chlorella sorokiniana]|uniref:Probable magnesium transporter n=1 Tax=Chlorella sorokiniana TaxID=3076 RepID=A0A2P6TBD5_CHLSO|nr:putative magnesium transporter NIPA8 [Chlorella sorokiniana]|eukprot:PRW05863.1 putative magnesium transporter NIPA8 [Chlorella sorokiniana]